MKLLRTLALGIALCVAPFVHAAETSVLRQYVKIIIEYEPDAKGEWEDHGYGSVVVIAPGYALTARHVVGDPQSNQLRVTGQQLPAHVVKMDDKVDLALLKVPGLECPCIRISNNLPAIDDDIYVVGFPLYSVYQMQYLTHGNIQGVIGTRMFTTALIAPGNSGGGMFVKEADGYRLMGITSAVVLGPSQAPFAPKLVMNWMSIAIPADVIRKFLKGTLAEQK